MQFLSILTITIFYFISALCFAYFFKREKITPVTIFVISQALFFAGFIKFLNLRSQEDYKIVLIYLIGLASFCAGSLFDRLMHPTRVSSKCFVSKPISKYSLTISLAIVLASFLLFVFFCYRTRLATIRIMLDNLLGRANSDITESRLASYEVPGTAIIYAFRIALLPTITIALIRKENRIPFFAKVILTLFMVFFSLITGQRGGFVYVMLMWILSYLIPIFSKPKDSAIKKQRKNIIVIIFAMVVVFFFMSLINGRVSGSLFGELFSRFFNDNQRTAYYGFHYIFENGTCWGRNYYEEAINVIVPGDKYLPLSKIIFEIMYGSTRGTAPVCLWGSVFYNFSWIGVVIFGFIYGVLCHYIGFVFYNKQSNSLRLVIYSYMFIDLGMLMAGGPFQLFNNGFVPLLILLLVLRLGKNNNSTLFDLKRKTT